MLKEAVVTPAVVVTLTGLPALLPSIWNWTVPLGVPEHGKHAVRKQPPPHLRYLGIASYHALEPLWLNLRLMRTEQINKPVTVSSEQTRVFFDVLLAF